MEKEIKEILLSINYSNHIFNYHTPYGDMVIKFDKNKLNLLKFIENPIWTNTGCKESLLYQINRISQNLKKSKL